MVAKLKGGKLFVMSAPSGAGKTTLAKMICREFPQVKMGVSYTTRQPRNGEVNGQDYHFISKEEFVKLKEKDFFLETAELFGYYYGTSKESIEATLKKGHHLIILIDTQGATQIKAKMEGVFIFIDIPSLDILAQRLSARNTEEDEEVLKRLCRAKEEIRALPFYDYCIVNEDLQEAFHVLKSIIIAEDHRV